MADKTSGNATAVAPKKSSNFEGIQALRFLAALMVVIAHSARYASERLGTGSLSWAAGINGVDIFFVISGFVMVASTKKTWGQDDAWKKFILRRLVRIVPMYWLATSFKLVVMLLAPAVVLHARASIVHIVSSYLFIPTINSDGQYAPLLGVGWTLDYEMFFYALFTVALFTKKNVYYALGAVLGVAAVLSVFRQPHMPAIAMYADTIVLEFFLGMLVAGFILKKGASLPLWASIGLTVVGCALVLLPRFVYPAGIPQLFIIGIPAAALVLGVTSLEPYIKGRIPRLVLLFGDASYVLYLFHPMIAPAVPAVFRHFGITIVPACILGSIAFALCVGTLLHLTVERYTTEKLKKLILDKRRPAYVPVG